MRKVIIITAQYYNQLEADLNRLLNKDNWEIKSVYSDGKAHYAVLEKVE